MSKFRIEKGVSRVTRVKLHVSIEESIAVADLALMSESANNDRNHVVNELLAAQILMRTLWLCPRPDQWRVRMRQSGTWLSTAERGSLYIVNCSMFAMKVQAIDNPALPQHDASTRFRSERSLSRCNVLGNIMKCRMALTSSTKLGVYEIAELLGAGGWARLV